MSRVKQTRPISGPRRSSDIAIPRRKLVRVFRPHADSILKNTSIKAGKGRVSKTMLNNNKNRVEAQEWYNQHIPPLIKKK